MSRLLGYALCLLLALPIPARAQSEANPKAPAASVASATSAEAPTMEAWTRDFKPGPGAYPRVLVFVRSLPENAGELPRFVKVDPDAFAKLSYLHVANGANAEWDVKLNSKKFSQGDSLPLVLALTGADTVVLAPDKGNWTILQHVNGRRAVVATAKPASSTSEAALTDWLFKTLNWDGVVLAQKGDFLLVGSTSALLAQPQIQALAVDASTEKLTLNAKERSGAGLLSQSDHKDGLGIFDIVLLGQGVKALPAGTKLLIEKKK